jgi:hypothetical protein
MSIGAFALMFLLAGAPQDKNRSADLQSLVDLVGSENIADRERGLAALKALDPSLIPQLKLFAGNAADAEARARLAEAVRCLTLREADRLLAEGRFTPALRMAAVAEGASDPDAAVADVKSQVALEIRGRYPSCPMDDIPTDLDSLAADLLDSYGPWALAVLFDALADDDNGIPAARLLAQRPDAVAPALRRALASPNPGLRKEACYVVYAMAFEEDNLPEDGVGLADALRIAAADPLTDQGTKLRISLILEKIGEIVKRSLFRPMSPSTSPRRDVRFLRATPP